MEFSSQRREMVLFFTTNMATVTSRAIQQFDKFLNYGNSKSFNPLSPNSDQQQFSPNNIHTMSRD